MTTRHVAILTGSRAEYGLLRPVITACQVAETLEVTVLATGTHHLPPAMTIEEVAAECDPVVRLVMQRPGETGRHADAMALGRGVTTIAEWLEQTKGVQVMLVLGDRIEALAGAAAASICGVRVAHVHGGDRAEGIADDSIRHAITKLAHLHFAASDESAMRLGRLGEQPQTIHTVGSPAIDGLAGIDPLDDGAFNDLGAPEIVILLHPEGRDDDAERGVASTLIEVCSMFGRVLVLDPNHDPGRTGIVEAIEASGSARRSHLPRTTFLRLLRRVRVLAGNSSAGLIEASALDVHCLNVGRRQHGRQKPPHVVDVETPDRTSLTRALESVADRPVPASTMVYGDGDAGSRIARILASFDPAAYPITK